MTKQFVCDGPQNADISELTGRGPETVLLVFMDHHGRADANAVCEQQVVRTADAKRPLLVGVRTPVRDPQLEIYAATRGVSPQTDVGCGTAAGKLQSTCLAVVTRVEWKLGTDEPFETQG